MDKAYFQNWTSETLTRIHQNLNHYLKDISYPSPKLQEVMGYATLNGGKRIRSLLGYASGKIFDLPLDKLDVISIAIELIHSYSLIHDDLPAMDNADLRRGQLSAHKAYGEDFAILAGDGLLTLAFEMIAR